MVDLKLMARHTIMAAMFGLAATLGGCATTIQKMEAVQATNGTPFTQALTEEYRGFVTHEKDEGDWSAARYFSHKGLAAAGGEVVLPEEVANVPESATGPLGDGRNRLMAALDGGARDSNPKVAAQAQRAFDCWLHEASEELGEDHERACRDEFMAAMEQLEVKPAMPAAAPPAQPSTYLVLFDFDKSDINAAAQSVINQVIADYNANKSTAVSVTGHTDRAGSDAYNERLSERRADTVREALIAGGIPAEAITTAWKGESENAVPTEDGVREQANRRAEVIIQ
jgi:OmpA-OmpF porin, OOP family